MIFIAGPANGSTAPPDAAGVEPASPEEGLPGQAVTPEEQEVLRAWVASLPDASPMDDKVFPKFECGNPPRNCPYNARCTFPGQGKEIVCVVVDCGEAPCRICPEAVSKLLVKGWCSYGCVGAEPGVKIGGAFILKTPFKKDDGNNGPYCVDKDGKVYWGNGKPVLW